MSSAHNVLQNLFKAPNEVVDPGTGVALVVDRSLQVIPLTIAASASETNTLAVPTKAGIRVMIVAASVGSGGTRVVTVASAVDQAGDTTLTFAANGDYAILESVPTATVGTYAWKLVSSEGAVATGHNENFNAVTAVSAAVNADGLTVGGAKVSPYKVVTVNCLLNAHCIDQAFFTADRAYQVTRVDEVHATAGNDAGSVNVQLVKDTSTNAPGAGTDLLTNNTNAGFNLKGTANTVQNGTLSATTSDLQLAAGDRLSLDFAGTVTALAGVQVTVQLKPI